MYRYFLLILSAFDSVGIIISITIVSGFCKILPHWFAHVFFLFTTFLLLLCLLPSNILLFPSVWILLFIILLCMSYSLSVMLTSLVVPCFTDCFSMCGLWIGPAVFAMVFQYVVQDVSFHLLLFGFLSTAQL